MTPEELDTLLAVDTDEEPRPGFDTRFHARLAEMKSARKQRFWLFAVSGAFAGAAAIAIAVWPHEPVQNDPAGLEIAMEYEMLENYEVVKDLSTLEMLAQLEEQP